jgi:hypothetical protein
MPDKVRLLITDHLVKDSSVSDRRLALVMCKDDLESVDYIEVSNSKGVRLTAPFQRGNPSGEGSRIGFTNEELLAAVKGRLEVFQSTKYSHELNDEAIYHITKAVEALKNRTRLRLESGKEGTDLV